MAAMVNSAMGSAEGPRAQLTFTPSNSQAG
jgi:hypothetical protein